MQFKLAKLFLITPIVHPGGAEVYKPVHQCQEWTGLKVGVAIGRLIGRPKHG